ncbi:hypothetical protein TpMuguga_01g00552 [Theileria parva strain Muguga]|uniref:Uncharacterized protein n=1 Tax=Theileria parva TaxID=5875 RepID=Q4N8C0_THEPA|nr:uncharacterized protein TpMuguga_01g00552 [Theileria parva strain Muguga]EAN33788.1 hypothetical protein TpMuguga_01g00552 [Theileria parva strain Muguga]|eukprot:XP_766071.1 hypothetical protein [Theileria parva strain Muguga]
MPRNWSTVLLSVKLVIGVNNGFPNPELGKPLPPLEPLTLDINIESATENTYYLEQSKGGIYTPTEGFGFDKVIQEIEKKPPTAGPFTALELIYKGNNPAEYLKKVICNRMLSKVIKLVLFLFNGDVKELTLVNSVWTVTNKLTLDITTVINGEHGTNFTTTDTPSSNIVSVGGVGVNAGIEENFSVSLSYMTDFGENVSVNRRNFTDFRAKEYNFISKIVYRSNLKDLVLVVWQAKNWFEQAKEVSFACMGYQKYLLILQVDNNYCLFKWDPRLNLWIDFTVNSRDLGRLKFHINNQEDSKPLAHLFDHYEVYLQELSYCVKFVYPPQLLRRYFPKLANSFSYNFVNNSVNLSSKNYKHTPNEVKRVEKEFVRIFGDGAVGYSRGSEISVGVDLDITVPDATHYYSVRNGNFTQFFPYKGYAFNKVIQSNIKSTSTSQIAAKLSSKLKRPGRVIWLSFIPTNYLTRVHLFDDNVTKYLLLYVKKFNFVLYKWEQRADLWINYTETRVDPGKLMFYSNGKPIAADDTTEYLKEFTFEIFTLGSCDAVSYNNKQFWTRTGPELKILIVKILENKVNLFLKDGKVVRFHLLDHEIQLVKQEHSLYQIQ